MKKTKRVPPEDRRFSRSIDEFQKKVLIRMEQESAEQMADLAFKFGKAVDLVLDTFPDTFATAKTYSHPYEPQRFVVHEKGSACPQYEVPSLL